MVRRDFATGDVDRLVAGTDLVVHAAGATRAPTVGELRQANVELTARVVDAAKAGGAKRLMLISSQAAAGPAPSLDAPVTEDAAGAPVEPYGRTKLDAETIVSAQRDVPAVIVRPSAVYGPGDRDFLALFRLAARGLAIHPANRSQWISILHVGDLSDAVLQCAELPEAAGRVYFVANDVPVQWSELFRLGAKCAGRTLHMDLELPETIVSVGAFLGDFAARLTGHASLATSGKVALSKPHFWVCSNARAKRELCFAPLIDLRDGMRETYAWYAAHGWL